ncbi:uncharacterized protein LOC130644743 isoform X3 [Hydractinia symbiolongicarpus]|uniref:uncharacterized protein LOC130644743 isoform X1 n=1 Tax=Hydractinia symbiolongicarpus TaxID=13093 RepID=UPI00254E7838|nr:uncharacterized protein LOC130644743 isoform X1 [Hydractinia symbiolongicarpus]XP_057306448.1 uncharacterized protein LOC130644743 isoform X2 [Hydractinia symbiolongicarpus]XP_057306449.1 uncharacterized protein LOC130644743 isoform X3 [Hydractinia symbiolongicarpus]
MHLKVFILLLIFTGAVHAYRREDDVVNASDNDEDEFNDEASDETDEYDDVNDEEQFNSSILRKRRRSRKCTRKTYSKCTVRHNGCGSKQFSKIPGPFTSVFKQACNKHDVCYNCGQLRSWSQRQCDKRFEQDMRKICKCEYKKWYQKITRSKCLLFAKTYYGIVKLAGKNFYLRRSLSWCKNNCVIPRGSPHVPF